MSRNLKPNLRLIDRYNYWMDSKFFIDINLQNNFLRLRISTQSNTFYLSHQYFVASISSKIESNLIFIRIVLNTINDDVHSYIEFY